MGFLDNLSDKLSKGTETVGKKAKEVSEYASLTAVVEKEKVVQEKLYNELGKKVYAECKDAVSEKCAEEIAKLDESFKKMNDAKDQIRDKKGNQICPGCGKEVAKGSKFCPACGAVMPEEAEEAPVEEAPANVCPTCGEKNEDDAMFCTKCGTKLHE